jgi:hypothetical protein
MSPHDNEQIDRFFTTIEPWKNAYSHIGLSFFAVCKDGEINLLQARLFLNTAQSAIPHIRIETASVLAGHLDFTELEIDLHDFVKRLVSDGEIETSIGKLKFPSERKGEFSAYFDPFHQEGIASGNRFTVLELRGARNYPFIEKTKLDWELKAAAKPYDSLDELLSILVLGGSRGDSASIEIVAYNVAAINFSSVISGTTSKPSIFLAKSLDSSNSQIGYRVFQHGKVVDRNSILGSELTWTVQDEVLQGEGLVEVPQGAALHCVVSYAGHAQQQGWIADPNNSQNSRRVLLEEFHNGLGILESYLFDEQRQGKDARDFEFGIAWLIWMLGFSASQVGGRKNTSDAADIVATTPSGNIFIVECTTGLLKSDKVAKLVERSAIVRKRLISSGNHHLKVLPVIITSKPKVEVKADIDDVKNKGVAVVTKEDLESMLSQTIVYPDAELIFNRVWEASQPKHDKGNV